MILGDILIGILSGAIVGAVIGAVVGELRAEAQTIGFAIVGAVLGASLSGICLGIGFYEVSMLWLFQFTSAAHAFSWQQPLFVLSWLVGPLLIPLLLRTISTSMERKGYNRNIVVTILLLTVGLGISLGLL